MNDPLDTNPLELEAQADELEAEAFRLRARAKRRRLEAEQTPPPLASPPAQMTRGEYAKHSRISEATVARLLAEGMPCIPVGSTVRIDVAAADEWRRARGRRPTKAATPKSREPGGETADVAACTARAGLRTTAGPRPGEAA